MNERDADNLATLRRAMRASDLESTLTWQMRVDNLPGPQMEYRFDDTRRWRFDFAWPDCRLAVEVNGGEWSEGRHSRGSGVAGDYEKLNAATIAGWRVLQFTGSQVRDGTAINTIRQALGEFDV